MSRARILDQVGAYYSEKLSEYGATARGVDWNSEESQRTRFDQLLKVCQHSREFSIVDVGCGYGALSAYLHECGYDFHYQGIDVSETMIDSARSLHEDCPGCSFTASRRDLQSADYAVASGVFNVKLEIPERDWRDYIFETIEELNELGTRGFAFNMLTAYSDADRMRPDLYYGDPGAYFDLCVQHFSRWTAALHDYGLYEFTIVVRKDL